MQYYEFTAVVIGFLNTHYTLTVDVGDNIQIGVIQGSLQRLVMVDVTIIPCRKTSL